MNRFLARAPFDTNLKHLPRLLGERPVSMTIIQTWVAGTIAQEWRARGKSQRAGNLRNGTFLLAPSGTLTSPKLRLGPQSVDAVIVCLTAERSQRARLQFKSANQPKYGKQGSVEFAVKGDGHLRDYRIEVGLLPSWVWRGPITGLRLQSLAADVPLELERIELVRYWGGTL